MIAFACPSCHKKLKVDDELAGKKVRCPGCGTVLAVPQAAATLASQGEPRSASLPDVKTLPPRNQGQGGQESLSDSQGQTDLGAGPQGEATRFLPAQGVSPELIDFLAPPQASDELGRLGGFRILKVLGHGGMGVVYQGEDPRLGRKVAIKAMLPHLAGSKSAQQRFLREARTAAALEHDHVVPILQVGEDRGAPYIVMPFLKGESLDQRLQREGKLPVVEVLGIGRETAEGLAAAHAAGLIHRDIKPANLWLEEPKGRVKILDFGLARAAADEAHLTQSGAIVGTPAYMAPEQAGGEVVDARCDLFSLGCVLYRLCTGVLPFKGKDSISTLLAVATENPKTPTQLNPQVPPALSELVMRLLAKKPDQRPPSAQVVAEALEGMEKGQSTEILARARPRPAAARDGGHGRVEAAPPRPAQPTRKRPPLAWLVGGGAVGVGALLLVLILLLRPGAGQPSGPEDGPAGGQGAPALPAIFTNSLGMEFVLVPRGKSWLGGGGGKPGERKVEILHDFYLGKYEVTQEEWEKVTGVNPSQYSRTGDGAAVKDIPDAELKRLPVENVSWDDCQLFIQRLNNQAKEAGWVYRLPTEVEWEYACRGGPMTDKFESAFDFYFEKPTNTFSQDQANFPRAVVDGKLRDLRFVPSKVGSYQPNRLGLYDMHGNAWEWCQDEWKDNKGASLRVIRGGDWHFGGTPGEGRAAARAARPPSNRDGRLGLRLARVPVGKEMVKQPALETEAGRKAAEWLLSIGGKGTSLVTIREGEKERRIASVKDLPAAGFQIVKVDLWGNPQLTDATAVHLKELGNLRELQLGATPLGDAGLAHLKGLTHLRALHLRDTRVTDAGLVHLKGLTDLEFLVLEFTPITGSGFVHLKELPKLESLSLWGCQQFTGEGLEHLKGLKGLNLDATKVNDAGLAHLQGLTRLASLDLRGTPVTDAGLAHLKGLTSLTHLPLDYTQVGDAGLVHLKACTKLARLYLKKTKVTARGIADLRKALPQCRIEWDGGAVEPMTEPGKGAGKLPPAFRNSLGMEFVLVPGGKSWLGGGGGNPGGNQVEIRHDFYLGKYEVTQEEWQKVMGKNPSRFKAVPGVSREDQKRFPVEQVSWEECQTFIKRLNEQVKEPGWSYRLPTALQWEYACRGGPMTDKRESAFHFYLAQPTDVLLPGQANFEFLRDKQDLPPGQANVNDAGKKQPQRTCKVGSYQPNRVGLYDMHGNVWEWCEDRIVGDGGAVYRAVRGGGWDAGPVGCCATYRGLRPASDRHGNIGGQGLGLRLARVPVGKEIVKKPAPETQAGRKAAEWVLSIGGRVTIRIGDKEEEVAAGKGLPAGDFQVRGIGFWINEHVTDDELARFQALTNLTGLGLAYVPVGDAGLAHLKGLTHLTSLSLKRLRITDAGLEHLKGLANLTELGLTEQAGINGPGLVYLKGLNKLTALDLAACWPLTTGLDQLPRGLTYLRVAGTKVGDAELAHLKGLTKLQHLDVGDTPVSDAGLVHLKELPSLTALDLNGSQVTDAGIVSLKACTKLTHLGVNRTKVSARGIEALRRALPKCKIEWDGAKAKTEPPK
jgi:formylglycine-generating enzyme required for sulfatase activity